MIYSRSGSIITLGLTNEEVTTVEYIEKLSSIMFRDYVQKFLDNRKIQQTEDLKEELVSKMDRTTLIAEVAKSKGIK